MRSAIPRPKEAAPDAPLPHSLLTGAEKLTPKEETVLSHVLDSEFDRYKVAIAASYAVVVAAAAARSSAQRGAKKKCVVL